MLSSGITAESLAKELNRTLSTSQSMLRSLITTGHAYLKEKNGKKLYYLKEEVTKKIIESKKNNGDNKLKKKSINKQSDSITILDNGPEGIKAEKREKEGIIIDNVPIQDISKIIQGLMAQMDASFNFEIITDGDKAQITLSENQIIDWAYNSIGSYIKDSD